MMTGINSLASRVERLERENAILRKKLGKVTKLHNWFLKREEYIETLVKACDVFDEYDGEEIPKDKEVWAMSNAWGDLAVWLFSNRKPTP